MAYVSVRHSIEDKLSAIDSELSQADVLYHISCSYVQLYKSDPGQSVAWYQYQSEKQVWTTFCESLLPAIDCSLKIQVLILSQLVSPTRHSPALNQLQTTKPSRLLQKIRRIPTTSLPMMLNRKDQPSDVVLHRQEQLRLRRSSLHYVL